MGRNKDTLIAAARDLSLEMGGMTFSDPVTHVYNPLEYARQAHEQYLEKYGAPPKKVVFLGMNPGPWGMAQTGVPFGEIAAAKNWLGIEAPVDKPALEHPKRPVLGFACPRSEVSGRRLWDFFSRRYATPGVFFEDHFVSNYCPLVFLEASGRNRTPDKLKAAEKEILFAACDRHLQRVVEILEPVWVIGIGRFTETCARRALKDTGVEIGHILHPSPASPAANRDWAGTAAGQLKDLGLL